MSLFMGKPSRGESAHPHGDETNEQIPRARFSLSPRRSSLMRSRISRRARRRRVSRTRGGISARWRRRRSAEAMGRTNKSELKRQWQTDSTKRRSPCHLRSTRSTIGATSTIQKRSRAPTVVPRSQIERLRVPEDVRSLINTA